MHIKQKAKIIYIIYVKKRGKYKGKGIINKNSKIFHIKVQCDNQIEYINITYEEFHKLFEKKK